MDGTHDSDDVPPLAASVNSLPEAVGISLRVGAAPDSLFILARAIKAFEITTRRKLLPKELEGAFALWFNTPKPHLPPDANFDEYRLVFFDTLAKTRAPLGANPLEEAIRLADSRPMPPEATRYQSVRLKRLLAVCYHLQRLQGPSKIFISVRDAARIMGTKDLYLANSLLNGLFHDKIFTEVEKPKPGQRKATRFRYNSPEFADPGDGASLESADKPQ